MADNKKPAAARPGRKKPRPRTAPEGEQNMDDMERDEEKDLRGDGRREAAPQPNTDRSRNYRDYDEDDNYRDEDRDFEDDRAPRRDMRDERDYRDRDRRPHSDNRRNYPADERFDERPEAQPQPAQAKPSDEYLLQVYYDKGARAFIGSVLEFPEIKSSGNSREGVIRDLEGKINNSLDNMRRRNEVLPEGYLNRRQPEKIEVKVSQSLFRRLEILARAEKVGVDQLLPELITAALERRADKRPEPQRQPQSNQGNRDRGHQRHGGQRHGGRGRNYLETMDSRENFMEYVRNLEKGGGAPGGRGNWRKK